MPPNAPDTERSLLDAIAEGELDDHLGAIAAAVDARRRLLHTIDSSHMLATLCTGDRVRIGQRVSPRYLAGLDGTIVELEDRAATVRLDFPVGRFESGRVRSPAAGARKAGVTRNDRPSAPLPSACPGNEWATQGAELAVACGLLPSHGFGIYAGALASHRTQCAPAGLPW